MYKEYTDFNIHLRGSWASHFKIADLGPQMANCVWKQEGGLQNASTLLPLKGV